MLCLQVMLPQNMATILTLAALQDQQTKAGGSAPSHHGAPPHTGGSPSPASGLVIMDPSKGGKFKFLQLCFARLMTLVICLIIISYCWVFSFLSVVVRHKYVAMFKYFVQPRTPISCISFECGNNDSRTEVRLCGVL
jgi:hypothetical protein